MNTERLITLKVPSQWKNQEVFLESPSLAAMLLSQQGIDLSNTGKLEIVDPKTLRLVRQVTFPFSEAKLHYVGKSGTRYYYESDLVWKLVGAEIPLKLNLELELAELEKGNLFLKIRTMGQPLPDSFNRYLEDKIQSVLSRVSTVGSFNEVKPGTTKEVTLLRPEEMRSLYGTQENAVLFGFVSALLFVCGLILIQRLRNYFFHT